MNTDRNDYKAVQSQNNIYKVHVSHESVEFFETEREQSDKAVGELGQRWSERGDKD